MNRTYFRYLLKHNRIAVIFFFAIYLTVAMMPVLQINAPDAQSTFSSSVYWASMLSLAMTFVLPPIMMSFVHRKRSADVYMALPITRMEMLITILSFELLLAFGYYLISTMIIYFLTAHFAMSLSLYLQSILIVLIGTGALLSVNTLLYLIGNNVIDGIVMMTAYTVLPIVIYYVILMFSRIMIAGYQPSGSGIVFEGMGWIAALSPLWTTYFNISELFVVREVTSIEIVYMALTAGYGVLGWIGLKREFILRRAERAEQLSDQFFAYPFIIMAYTFTVLFLITAHSVSGFQANQLIYYLLLLLLYIIATFVYQRRLHLQWKRIGLFAGVLAAALCLSEVSWKTRCFGRGDHYSIQEGTKLVYTYSATVRKEDLGKSAFSDEYSGDRVSVSFHSEIPLNQIINYQEEIDLMEKLRRDTIDRYYSGETRNEYLGSSLSVSNIMGKPTIENVHRNFYSYYLDTPLSEEQLRILNTYGEVEVFPEEGSGMAYSLNEFLDKRALYGTGAE